MLPGTRLNLNLKKKKRLSRLFRLEPYWSLTKVGEEYLLWKRPFLFLGISNFSFYPKNNEIEQSFFQFTSFPQLAWHMGHFNYHFIASFGYWKGWVWNGNSQFTAVQCRVQEGSDHQEVRKHICHQGFNSHPSGDGRKQTWRWVSSSPAPTDSIRHILIAHHPKWF